MRAVFAFVLLCCVGSASAQVPRGVTVSGRQVALLGRETRAAVLFFVATDCPISNRMMPEMARLERAFAERGVRFWFVYPNVTEADPAIRRHQEAYGQPGGAEHTLRDPGGRLARLSGATVTPEAAILLPGAAGAWRAYAGRIDDRYLAIGNERPRATRHDLEQALEAALGGRAVPLPGGPAVGCGIVSTR